MANYFLTPRDRLKLSKGKQSADSTAARYQLFDSVTRFLLNTARRKPLIILFDNLHLADRSSLALLEYFCQQIVGHPVLIVGAYRESEHSTISRVVLHRKAGEQLEIRYRQDLLSHVSQLAHHYFEAAQAGKERKAVVYCRQAAEMANAQRAYGEAAALFDCALQAAQLEAEPDLESRFELLLAMGQAQYHSGQLNIATTTLMKSAILAH